MPSSASSRQEIRLGAWLLLALWLLPFPALAECLGCPGDALRVTVHLKDGTAAHGVIEIHQSKLDALIGVRPLPLERARWAFPEAEVSLWERSVSIQQVFDGPSFLLRGQPSPGEYELQPLGDSAAFTLPLLVLGDPRGIPISKIDWIEERPDSDWRRRLLGKPFHADSETAQLVLLQAQSAVEIRDRRETSDGMIWGVSFRRHLSADELARTCIENAGFYELWSEDGIVCVNWGGST